MSGPLLDALAVCALLDDVAPAGERRTATGARLRLATAELGGRRVLLAELDGWAAGDAVEAARLAESLGLPSIIIAALPLDGPASATAVRGAHVVVGPAPSALASAALSAVGLLHVAVGDPGASLPLLVADDAVHGLDLAALLLGYLPGPDGTAPVYEAVECPELVDLQPAERRNAVQALHELGDDALRVLAGPSDELVLALARVQGRSLAVVVPQRLAGPVLDAEALERLTALLLLAERSGLVVVVLGGLQPLSTGAGALRTLATVLATGTHPLLLITDDAPASPLDDLLAAAPAAVRLDPAAGLRAAIGGWLGALAPTPSISKEQHRP